ncbi:hypothetical protein [Paenibacillus sp. XY044]|uniref:hypothetical protein n=1 Tax=Paenibacillus sp. XY044 TaxID=2026089 RepID=UPI000B982705|nr:hypothetical protein [Paenibacillus sp. XY044]OZB93585.1 hypothetical protein CJP46_21570 [Paenibacillus sp. XY044]
MKQEFVVDPRQAAQLVGQPVWVVLKDGTQYVGYVTGIEDGQFVLSAARGRSKMTGASTREKEVQVSGIFSALFGGGSQGSGQRQTQGQPGGIMGMFGQIIPNIRVGMNVLKMIMPLMGAFKI